MCGVSAEDGRNGKLLGKEVQVLQQVPERQEGDPRHQRCSRGTRKEEEAESSWGKWRGQWMLEGESKDGAEMTSSGSGRRLSTGTAAAGPVGGNNTESGVQGLWEAVLKPDVDVCWVLVVLKLRSRSELR